MASPQIEELCRENTHTVHLAAARPSMTDAGTCPIWAAAETLAVASFHPNSTSHRPPTTARILVYGERIYVTFHVLDRYVRSVCTEYQSNVCKDSCVEFFVQPKADAGYVNFEINAGGTMLLHYNPPRLAPGPRPMVQVPVELAREVEIHTSLPRVIEPEIQEPVEWRLTFSFPIALLEHYVGALRPLSGSVWRANFYKIASHTSHPHWGSWNPIGERLDYHQPDRFGELRFA